MAPAENLASEALFAQRMEHVLDLADKTFSGEEGHGKYLDLHKHYFTFCRLSKLRKLGLIKSDDYLSWLQNFHRFELVPLHIKQNGLYAEYVNALADYLKDFLQRSKPLEDFAELREQTDEMFEMEWEQRSLFGWESAIAKLHGEKLPVTAPGEEGQNSGKENHYCQACRKTFSNPTVYDCHLKGKRHIKAAA